MRTGSTTSGTPQWMAPEMVRGEKHFEDRFKADVWSVGCTVIEMLTGHTPWQDIANPITVMYVVILHLITLLKFRIMLLFLFRSCCVVKSL